MAANRDCDAHLLVAGLHRRAMLLCSQAGNRPFQGLSAAGTALELNNKWRRRLRIWDAVLGLTEKISPASVEAHLAELQQELLRAAASTTTKHTRPPSASSTSSAASWAEGCFDSICGHLEVQQDQGEGDTRRQSHQADRAAGLRHEAEHRARQSFVASMATTPAIARPAVEIKLAEADHIKYPTMVFGCLPPSPIPCRPRPATTTLVAPPSAPATPTAPTGAKAEVRQAFRRFLDREQKDADKDLQQLISEAITWIDKNPWATAKAIEERWKRYRKVALEKI